MSVQRFASPNGFVSSVAAPLVAGGFDDAVAFYLEWHSAEGHTPRTIIGVKKHFRIFEKWLASQALVNPPLSPLTPPHILCYLPDLQRRGAKPQTRRSAFSCLRAFFNWAVDWSIIETAPTAKLKPPKVPDEPKPFLPAEAYERILAMCPPVRLVPARRTAWSACGLISSGKDECDQARSRIEISPQRHKDTKREEEKTEIYTDLGRKRTGLM